MAERRLTFAEVQQILGLTPDEVRELMESKRLHGDIVDGVIQFRESEVMHLRGGGAAPRPGGAEEDMGLVFLVDEEEEKEIEGQAYDGEELLTRREAVPATPDEEIMEPVDLSEEQRRNAELLGADAVVEFGREVSERTREEAFGTTQLSEGEEIIEPSEVSLPEPEFGPLAGVTPEARREEPVEAAPPPEQLEPEPAAVEPEEEVPEPVAPVPEEPPVEAVSAAAEPTREELAFLEERAEALPEEAPAEEAPAEPEVVEPAAPPAPGLTFEEEQAEPVAEAPPEVPVEEAPEELTFEETPEPEEVAGESAEVVSETFEVTTPEPRQVGVTDELELSVDEELGDLEPEPEVVEIEELAAAEEEAPPAERPSEPEPTPVEPEAVEEPAPPELEAVSEEAAEPEAPEEEVPAPEPALGPAAAAGAAAATDVWQELQEELAAEEGETEEAPVEPVAAEADRFTEPVFADSETPRPVGVEKTAEEAEQVTEEKGEEERAEQPEEEKAPLEEAPKEEAAPPPEEEPVPVEEKPAEAGTFELADMEEAAPLEEIEVVDLEATPTAEAEEEELVVLEEEVPAREAAVEAAGAKTLEEEVAELFGEETVETPPDEAFAAPAAEEDFDLSVFQQEAAVEETLPAGDESLFEVGEEPVPTEVEQPPEGAAVESVSRIRALTEERAAPSTVAFTAAILLAFAAVAFTGMLIWHLFNTG